MAIPTDHIYHYTMHNVAYSTLLEESDGSPGQMVDCSIVPGKFGDGLAVANVSGANVEIPKSIFSGLGSFTISLWVKLNELATTAYIVSAGSFNSPGTFALWRTNAAPHPYKVQVSNGTQLVGNHVPTTDVWDHVVVTFVANDRARLYVNGVFDSEALLATTPALSDLIMRIGNTFALNAGYQLDGMVDQLRLYERVLSQAEITELFNEPSYEIAGTITETLPIGEWRVIVSAISDGRVIGSTTVADGAYSVPIPYWDAGEMYTLTCVPDQGSKWIASTAVIIDQLILPPNTASSPYYYKVTVAGTSGASEPVWATTPGNTFADGTVTLECVERLVQPQIHGPVVATVV